MLLSFQADVWIVDLLKDSETGELPSDILTTALTFVPTVLYSALVFLANMYYLHLAHHLTEWENHRTQEQFERYDIVSCKRNEISIRDKKVPAIYDCAIIFNLF